MKKICNCCGKSFSEVPKEARSWFEDGLLLGWFWECDCNSTMFKKAIVIPESEAS